MASIVDGGDGRAQHRCGMRRRRPVGRGGRGVRSGIQCSCRAGSARPAVGTEVGAPAPRVGNRDVDLLTDCFLHCPLSGFVPVEAVLL